MWCVCGVWCVACVCDMCIYVCGVCGWEVYVCVFGVYVVCGMYVCGVCVVCV